MNTTTTAPSSTFTAFHGAHRIASGDLDHVARETKHLVDRGQTSLVVIFEDSTGRQVDIDFRGTIDDVGRRVSAMQRGTGTDVPETPKGPGRPRLGVVAREVTLLPRHWDWLTSQPGGASVALRKLVEEARRTHRGLDQTRQAQEAAYRFMSTMAGDLAGFEEAARALFGGNRERFNEQIGAWPADIREHASRVAGGAFQPNAERTAVSG